MKNVTISLDEETARWARIHAAERDVSLSKFISELLHERMRRSRDYEEAMRAVLNEKLIRFKEAGERYLTREEAHDRAGLRRR